MFFYANESNKIDNSSRLVVFECIMSVKQIAEAWASVDPLGEALHSLRMSGTFYARSELTAPWGMDLPAMPGSASVL